MSLSPPPSPQTTPSKTTHMERALALAREAAEAGEVPVGAVVTLRGAVVAEARNETLALHDPTAHAEVLAIRRAGAALGSQRLVGCNLHVTLEPCAMCAAAISFARIERLYFGAGDAKGGAVLHGPRLFQQPTCHHAPEVYDGIAADEAERLLHAFFAERR